MHLTRACVPADGAFQDWATGIDYFRGGTCGQDPPWRFTDPLTELRGALADAYRMCGLAPPRYGDPRIVRGVTPIKSLHWTELRGLVVDALEAKTPY